MDEPELTTPPNGGRRRPLGRRAVTSGADQTSVRRHNLSVVLQHVAVRGARSRARIAAETGFNKTTVSSLVSELIERGLIRETGLEENPGSVGRPAQTVELDGDGVVAIGLEVNVDHLSVCASDLGGTVRYRKLTPDSNAGSRAPEVVARLGALACEALDAVEAEGLRPVGVAVALPGLVEPSTGTLIMAPNLGWREVRMAELLGGELGRPELAVDVDNDGNLGALGELWEGVGNRLRDFVFVSGETGVGAGIVTGGELLRGAHGFSGEFGHMTIHPDGALCGCGARGCLETVIGQEALLRRAGVEVDDAARTAVLAAELLARAEDGDPVVLEVLDDAGAELGRALASVANLLNPEAVVLGGQFALLARWLAPAVEREMRTRVLSSRWAPCQVVASELGGDAAVRGAAALSLRRVLHEPWTVAAV